MIDEDLNEDLTLTLFRHCADLSGRIQEVLFFRRNRHLVPYFPPAWADSYLEVDEGDLQVSFETLLEHVSQNLTPVEKATWLKLLNGQSVAEIAREEGVSRTAIYERIRGKSNGHGGMTTKNPFVWLWWDRRKRSKDHE